MVEILQSKNLTTKFQILVEVAANQPTIHQKSIAARLNITPQAVSDYMMKLEQAGWVASEGRSRYSVTREGINWMLKMLRQMDDYVNYVRESITNLTVCAAIADANLAKGQRVGLIMKSGVLVAVAEVGDGASGIAVSEAQKGEDVGISNIEGIIDFQKGRLTVLRVADIQRGGSKSIIPGRLKKEIGETDLIGAIGIEAVAALRRNGIEPSYVYGVPEAAVEAARTGMPFVIVCTADAIPSLVTRLSEESFDYRLVDLSE